MKAVVTGVESLHRMFAAMTEQTFQVQLGVADPPLIDYLVDLLVRYVRMDAIFRVRDTRGRRLEEVAEMLMEAENRTSRPQRELYRHIGDFTLFWSGVYPEALRHMQAWDCKDHLIDYCEKGKQSYLIASRFADEEYRDEAPVLRRLSADFELCSYGLNQVRREWEASEN
jgi:hypothetical protein